MQTISKAQFKAKMLDHLRIVERKKQPLIITHLGIPVVKVIPYTDENLTNSLNGTVLKFEAPNKPVAQRNWKALK